MCVVLQNLTCGMSLPIGRSELCVPLLCSLRSRGPLHRRGDRGQGGEGGGGHPWGQCVCGGERVREGENFTGRSLEPIVFIT